MVTPEAADTWASSEASRPRSNVVQSTIVLTPAALASRRAWTPLSISPARPPQTSGQLETIPGEDATTCSWTSTNPRSSTATVPVTLSMPAMNAPGSREET
jgi:hypothetical protein